MDLHTLLNSIPEDMQTMVHFMNCTLGEWNYEGWSIDDNKYCIEKKDHSYTLKIVG